MSFKKRKFGMKRLEQRLLLDAAAVAAISDAVLHFDATDIDGDGDTADQPVEGSPEQGRTADIDLSGLTGPLTISGGGDSGTNIDKDNFSTGNNALFAFDLTFDSNPAGSIYEYGGGGRGTYIGFNNAGDFVARAGYGGTNAGTTIDDTARVSFDPTGILEGKTGTLYVEIDMTAESISVWFQEGGAGSGNPITSLGSATAADNIGGGNDDWSGGNDGGVGTTNNNVAGNEVTAVSPFNGSITGFRYYDNQLFAQGTTNVSTWVDQALDPSDNTQNDGSSGGTAPTLDIGAFNGGTLAGVDFSGTSDEFLLLDSNDVNIDSAGYDEKSFAFVFKTGSSITSDQIIYKQGGMTNGYFLGIFDADGAGPGTDYHLYAYAYGNLSDSPDDATNDTSAVIDLGAVSANTEYSVIMIHDANDSGRFSAALDGGAIQTVNTLGNVPTHTGDPEIGGTSIEIHTPFALTDSGTLVNNLYFNGSIAEIWSWNTALTNTEITSVNSYFGTKWGLSLVPNTPPTASDNTVTATEDTNFVFGTGDFNYVDADSQPLDSVRIDSLPLAGTLFLDADNDDIFDAGEEVSATDIIAAADITAGHLQYAPALNANGAGAASFTFSVYDSQDYAAAPSTITIDITPVNDAPVIVNNTASVTTVNFNDYTINSAGSQDGQGGQPTAFAVQDGGATLYLEGNSWRSINLPYTITADTVIRFDYRSTSEGEIHGLNFSTDNDYDNSDLNIQIDGDDPNGAFNQDYLDYELSDGWKTYTIPVGTIDTGAFNHILFIADDDASGNAISYFRNFQIYENTGTPVNVAEGGTLNIDTTMITEADPDDSGAGLTYTLTSGPSNGQLELTTDPGNAITSFTQADLENGHVVYIHDGSETTVDSFDFSLADGGENGAVPDTSTFYIAVTPVDDALVANNGTLTTNEDTAGTIDLGTLVSDADDAIDLTDITVGGAVNGSIVYDSGTGIATFTPDANYNGAASFTYTIDDGTGPITRTVNVTVDPVNDAPTASDNTITLAEDTARVLTAADFGFSDIDGDSLSSVLFVTVPTNGSLFLDTNGNNIADAGEIFSDGALVLSGAFSSGLVKYIGSVDGNGVAFDTLDFRVSDGTVQSATQTITFDITPVNDAPTDMALSNASVDENSASGTLVGTLSTTDVDLPGDTFTYSLSDDAGGRFQINGDRIEVAGGLNHEAFGSHNITVQVSDGTTTYNESFTITVDDVNDAPSDIILSANDIDEDSALGTVIATVSATDADLPGDMLTLSIANDPDNKFILVGNELRLNGALDFDTAMSHSVTLRVNDGSVNFDKVFSINVNDIAAPPPPPPGPGPGPGGGTPPPGNEGSGGSPPDQQNIIQQQIAQNGFGPQGDNGASGSQPLLKSDGPVQRQSLNRDSSAIGAVIRGDTQGFNNAVHGDKALAQIIHENVVMQAQKINDSLGNNNTAEQSVSLQAQANQGQNPAIILTQSDLQRSQGFAEQQASDVANAPPQFTNLREALQFFNDMESTSGLNEDPAEQEETQETEIKTTTKITRQFEDVLTYHEQRKARLLSALQS